jgi:chorismate dehydratase
MTIPASTIHTYLTSNIFYHLDEECLNGLRKFYEFAAESNILPPYSF